MTGRGRELPGREPTSVWPPIEELVPHRGAMLWLEEVVSHDEQRTHCRIATGKLAPFREERPGHDDRAQNEVDAWWALEWMAQCVAAHDGLERRRRSPAVAPPAPRIGLLLGSNRLQLHRTGYSLDDELEVEVVHVWSGSDGAASFDCFVMDPRDGGLAAEGRLTCIVPDPREIATILA